MQTGEVHRNQYDNIRCPVCGWPWLPWTDPATGRTSPGHPEEYPCHRHKPPPDPGPVVRARRRQEAYDRRHGTHPPAVPAAGTASNLPAVADDAEAARRELAGGATREWADWHPPMTTVGQRIDAVNRAKPLWEVAEEQIAKAKGGPNGRPQTEPDDLYDQ